VEYENGLAVRFIPLPPEHEAAYQAAVREVVKLLVAAHISKVARAEEDSKEWTKTG